MSVTAFLKNKLPPRYQKLALGFASFSVLWKLGLLLLLWPLLSQESHPFRTSLAVLQVAVLHQPYARISDQPETFLLGHDKQRLFHDRDLVFKDQLGALILLDQHGQKRCAWTRTFTRWFGVLELDPECSRKPAKAAAVSQPAG